MHRSILYSLKLLYSLVICTLSHSGAEFKADLIRLVWGELNRNKSRKSGLPIECIVSIEIKSKTFEKENSKTNVCCCCSCRYCCACCSCHWPFAVILLVSTTCQWINSHLFRVSSTYHLTIRYSQKSTRRTNFLHWLLTEELRPWKHKRIAACFRMSRFYS